MSGTILNEIMVNGVIYKRDCGNDVLENSEYHIVRTYSAGVFAGIIVKRDGKEATLKNARRIWRWDGAASLSELATLGSSKPKNCKFPAPVEEVLLIEVIEILKMSGKSRKSIYEDVPVWTEHA